MYSALTVYVQFVCVFTAVCVHFGWVKRRARIPSMGHHTWSYFTSLTSILIDCLKFQFVL